MILNNVMTISMAKRASITGKLESLKLNIFPILKVPCLIRWEEQALNMYIVKRTKQQIV